MTPQEYRQSLSLVGLTPASKATAAALGVSVRTSQRYASGATPVPPMVQIKLSNLSGDWKRTLDLIIAATG